MQPPRCCSEQPEVKMSSKAGEKPWVRRGCRASEGRNLQQWFPSGREWPYSERELWEQGHFEQSKITGDSGKSRKALEKKKTFKSGSIFLETKAVKKSGKQRRSPQPSSEIQRTDDFSRSPCQKSKTVATESFPPPTPGPTSPPFHHFSRATITTTNSGATPQGQEFYPAKLIFRCKACRQTFKNL